MTNNEVKVKEAEKALKGLLGIGSASGDTRVSSDISTSAEKQSSSEHQSENKEVSCQTPKNSTSPKKKKNKSKKKKKSVEGDKEAARNPKNSSQKASQKKKKGGKKSPSAATPSNTQNNYAMSALFSPPDPSNLPLPAFNNLSFEDTTEAFSTVDAVVGERSFSPSLDIKASEDFSQQSHNDTERNTLEGEANITLSTGVNENTSKDVNEKRAMSQRNQPSEHDRDMSGSASGVNLAAIASATPTQTETPKAPQMTTPNKEPEHEIDPLAMLMNGSSYGTSNPSMNYPHAQQYPLHYPMPPPNPAYGQSHPMMHHPHLHPPTPSYMTIQVQVPSVLGPGRRMMAPGSLATGGYPIPVIVPEGMQPGMIMNVTIPALPAPHGPGSLPMHPSHMMPPNMMGVNTHTQHVQGAHNLQAPMHFQSPVSEKKNIGPAPGSWAARVAKPEASKTEKGD